MSTREDIALCLGRALSCQAEEIVGRLEPRASEVLASNGYPALLPPQGCIPALAPGDATGQNGDALLACQTAIEKQGARYGKTKQAELQACMTANLACHLPFELPGGSLDPACVAEAHERCDTALDKIAAAETKKVLAASSGAASRSMRRTSRRWRRGSASPGLAPICQALTPRSASPISTA